jgi:hypothetical protein
MRYAQREGISMEMPSAEFFEDMKHMNVFVEKAG